MPTPKIPEEQKIGYRGPLVERHYVLPGSTKNLAGVAEEIPAEVYQRMALRILMLGRAQERVLGKVEDSTTYYYFYNGMNVLLRNGLAQAGGVRTTDNPVPFGMIRLFANSPEQMQALEIEVGRHEEQEKPTASVQPHHSYRPVEHKGVKR